MTTAAVSQPELRAPSSPSALSSLRRAFRDALAVTERNLIALTRTPEALFFLTVQPIMFVLLFRYVFGGAIHVKGFDYIDFLMPGVFVQTVAFGAVGTSIGMAEDIQKGLIERFRALPMARSAVLSGRTLADLVRCFGVVVVITLVGLAVGFRPHGGPVDFIAAIGLLLLFSHAASWGFSIIGLTAPDSETAQVMSFPVLFPLTFASSAFVPVKTMPTWLQVFVRNQPVTQVIDASRDLMLGQPKGFATALSVGGSTSHAVLAAVIWCVALLAVLAPVAVYRYRRIV
jgi:ABC transporter DrrB family efflux protein